MIAVFCRYEKDFKELNARPRKMFRRIRSAYDVRGVMFSGIITVHDWYRGDQEITEAYDLLLLRQPELFKD